VIAIGIGESMCAASYSLLMVLSRTTAQPAVFHLHVEAVLGIETHGMRHDDGRGAGDGNESDLEVLLFGRRSLGKNLSCLPQREELRYGRQRGRGADGAQERPAAGIFRKQRADHGRFHRAR
jgi:hypothetical protein